MFSSFLPHSRRVQRWNEVPLHSGNGEETPPTSLPPKRCSQGVVMVAHMGRNQSGAEKDNRLLFGERWALLFSKSKMAPRKIGPIRSRIKNSRGGTHESRPCWKTVHQPRQRTWDRSHGFPWRHKSRRGHAKILMQLQTRYLQCPVVLNDRGPSGKRPDWETWVRV